MFLSGNTTAPDRIEGSSEMMIVDGTGDTDIKETTDSRMMDAENPEIDALSKSMSRLFIPRTVTFGRGSGRGRPMSLAHVKHVHKSHAPELRVRQERLEEAEHIKHKKDRKKEARGQDAGEIKHDDFT
ncbi:hypothetical protein HK104_000496 [Borealophlyctis nickersoniae]|nr:hypothetical protein HK104_000496 [Borealophlyctis nickersoniae]